MTKEKITIGEFLKYIEQAEEMYPNAKVASIGTGCFNGEWYWSLFLDIDGKEKRFDIFCEI